MRAPGEPGSAERLPAGGPGAKSSRESTPADCRPQPSTAACHPAEGRSHRAVMTTTQWYRKRYRVGMAMNLRLPGDLADALRALADQTGRSQQDLAREALTEYIRDYPLRAYPKEVRHMITPASLSLNDPEVVAELRSLWGGIDTEALVAHLIRDRQEDWR